MTSVILTMEYRRRRTVVTFADLADAERAWTTSARGTRRRYEPQTTQHRQTETNYYVLRRFIHSNQNDY